MPATHKSRKVIQRTLESNKDRARWERVLDEHLAMAEAAYLRGADSLTILGALPAWLASMEDAEVTEEHVRKCDRVVRWFASSLGDTASDDARFDQVRRADVEALRHKRRQVVMPSTVNGEVGLFKTFARWCIDHELWSATPEAVTWLRIKPLGMKARKPVKLSPKSLAKVLNVLPLHGACPLLFLYLVGDRPSACIYELLWGDVDMPASEGARGNVSLRRTKTGYRDIAFVGADDMDRCLVAARTIFERIRKRSPRSYDRVFLSWRSGSAWTGPGFDRALKYHLQRSGMLDLYPYCGVIAQPRTLRSRASARI